MPGAVTRGALTLTLALAPVIARADDRVLWVRERGVTRAPPPRVIVPTAVVPAGPGHVAGARAALVAAREQFLASAFQEAAATLREAAAVHVEHVVRSDRVLALEVLHWAGACALLANNQDSARETLRRALAIGPEAGLPATVFPPVVEAFFEDIRRASVMAGPTERTIRSTPVGARVEVDGRDEGTTPVTLRLTHGVHYLRLERSGYRTWMGTLQADESSQTSREIFLTEATGTDLRAQVGDPAGLVSPPDAPTLRRIVAEYGVDRVMVSLRDGTEVTFPPRQSVLPWVLAGAGVALVGIGVATYFLARPDPTISLVAP